MDENTFVLETFLPKTLVDSIPERLLSLYVEFGYVANQDVVQVEVCHLAYWLPTGLLIDAERAAAYGQLKEDPLGSD